MERRRFLKQATLTAAVMAFIKGEVFSAPANRRDFNFKEIRNGVGYFTEQGGTIAWLNAKTGYAVVDSQFPNTAVNLIQELKNLGDKPIKYLLNTHHHGDHTGGNIAFKGIVEHIVAHQNALVNHKLAAEKANNVDKQLFATTTFGKGWRAPLGDERIEAYYYGSGHTNGDVVYHFQNANIAHMGDLMFNRRFPFIDKENGAHIGNWITILDTVVKQFDGDTIFIFGHAKDPQQITGNKADILAFRNYLDSLLIFVQKEITAGKPLSEILKATTIPGAPEWTGDGIQRSLNAAYTELTAR
ncbi:MAG: MBL fold metallo-hydrolase [Pedobacter sp.]|nr:MAG: MBL fold metallo-hydrolase [Pedobacter sp.]